MFSSPPPSPTSRRRRTSSVASSDQATQVYSPSRRSSIYSPVSRRSSRIYGGDGSLPNHSSTSVNGDFASSVLVNQSNGLGSLADELAGAMEEDEGVDEGVEEIEPTQQHQGRAQLLESPLISPLKVDPERTRDSGIDVGSSPVGKPSDQTSSHSRHPSKSKHSRTKSRTHSRKQSRVETVSHDKVQSADDIPPSLQACIAEIETLARQGPSRGDTIDEVDDTVGHFVGSLRDLGGQQSKLESHATRLITAHASLSMHLAHQSRTLQSLTYYLLAPLPSQPLFDDDDESNLLPLVVSAMEAIPRPTFEALQGLHRLFTTSTDLNASLSSLSDSLHMSRQVTSTATRRLKGAKELVAEMRHELQASEDGIKWIEDGQWGQKLERRECANVCRDVVGGFEDVCNGWRSKLEQSAASAKVAVA